MEWTTEIGCAYSATFTIADQSGETRLVTIQFKDWAGNNLTVPVSVLCYTASDATGLTPTALADEELLEATYGKLQTIVTKTLYQLISTAAGKADVTVTENGTDTYYLVLVLPNGKLVVSDALTFV